MKLEHYLIIFVIVLAAVFVGVEVKINSLETMDKRTSEFNETIDNAVDESLRSMLEVTDSFNHNINLESCSDTFFKAVYAGFGAMDSATGKEQLKMYVPVLLVTDEDGFYLMYHSNSQTGDYTETAWTPKMAYYYAGTLSGTSGGTPVSFNYQISYTMNTFIKLSFKIVHTGGLPDSKSYYFEDHRESIIEEYEKAGESAENIEALKNFMTAATATGQFLSDSNFEKFRQSVMTYQITKKMNYWVNEHNKIARNYGISYNFSLPESSMDSVSRAIEDVSLLAIFQGFPYGKGTDDVYSRFSLSGSRMYKATRYVIVQEGSQLYYHRYNCKKLPKTALDGIDLPEDSYETASTRRECAQKGAYPCPDCNP